MENENSRKWDKFYWGIKSKGCDGNQPPIPSRVEKTGNKIFFYSDVTDESILRLSQFLEMAQNENIAKMINSNSNSPEPIYLEINSYGGEIFAGFTASNKIMNMKVPVVTWTTGICASAATLLYLSGARKCMSQNSFILMHQISSGFWGNYDDIQNEYFNVKKLMEHLTAFYMAKTKMKMEEWEEIQTKDLYLDMRQCKKWKMVDEIVS